MRPRFVLLLLVVVKNVISQTTDPPCAVCGTGMMVTMPDAVFAFPDQPALTCGSLESVGADGELPTGACQLLPGLIGPTCGCAPALGVGLSEACSICGPGLEVGSPDAVFVFPGEAPVPCGALQQSGANGTVPTERCPVLPSLVGTICECQPSSEITPNSTEAPAATPTTVAPVGNLPVATSTEAPISVPPVVSPDSQQPVGNLPVATSTEAPISAAPVLSPDSQQSTPPSDAPQQMGLPDPPSTVSPTTLIPRPGVPTIVFVTSAPEDDRGSAKGKKGDNSGGIPEPMQDGDDDDDDMPPNLGKGRGKGDAAATTSPTDQGNGGDGASGGDDDDESDPGKKTGGSTDDDTPAMGDDDDSEYISGKGSAGKGFGKGSDQGAGKGFGKGSDQGAGKGSGKGSSKGAGKGSGKGSSKGSGKGSSKGSGKGTVGEGSGKGASKGGDDNIIGCDEELDMEGKKGASSSRLKKSKENGKNGYKLHKEIRTNQTETTRGRRRQR